MVAHGRGVSRLQGGIGETKEVGFDRKRLSFASVEPTMIIPFLGGGWQGLCRAGCLVWVMPLFMAPCAIPLPGFIIFTLQS